MLHDITDVHIPIEKSFELPCLMISMVEHFFKSMHLYYMLVCLSLKIVCLLKHYLLSYTGVYCIMSVGIVDVMFMLSCRKPSSTGNILSPFFPCSLSVLWKSLYVPISLFKNSTSAF